MSGVCPKHERYVQDGETCPYCEPDRVWVYDVPMGRPLPEPIVFGPPPLGLMAALPDEYASIFGIDDPPSVFLKGDA